jgi:chemotaxis protein methyltransferase CheR
MDRRLARDAPADPPTGPGRGRLEPTTPPRFSTAASSLLGETPPLDPAEYRALAHEVRALLGIDLDQYKAPQVWRRVHAFGTLRGCADWRSLVERCRREPDLRAAFRDMLTINVSEFFRDPAAWQAFTDLWLRPRLEQRSSLRIWSAGCSIGFEPYTIAMLVKEIAPRASVRILATDVDSTALAAAMRGRFQAAQMKGLSEARRDRFFAPIGTEWQVRPALQAMITFRRHDLLRDPFETGFDAILCRNVVIYFTDAAKASLYRRFVASLRPDGVLFVGATEAIPDAPRYGLRPIRPGLFGVAVGEARQPSVGG